jgi:hypothetical protein
MMKPESLIQLTSVLDVGQFPFGRFSAVGIEHDLIREIRHPQIDFELHAEGTALGRPSAGLN